MTLLQVAFWLLAGLLVYIYIGYPLVVAAISRVRSNDVKKGAAEPTVTLVIAAHNEERYVGGTLANKLALDYPAEKLQIIVVSDGSTDKTDDIVRTYASRGVVLIRQEPRNGKTAALNMAVGRATGEVLVFADGNSLYERSALRHLASNFADPAVGYVTGKLVYRNADGSLTGDGCSSYMRYENFIRVCETSIGSLVGVNGGIDAVRRSLYEPMKADDLPDLVLPLKVVARGYRAVFEPLALLSESANANSRDEYRMRVRVSLRALWTLAEMPEMLNVGRHGFYALQVWSHKVLRYLAFFFIACLFATSIFLWPAGGVYRLALILQILFTVCAGLGFVSDRVGRPSRLFSAPYYFALVNAAALHAFVKFLKGDRHRVWSPRLG